MALLPLAVCTAFTVKNDALFQFVENGMNYTFIDVHQEKQQHVGFALSGLVAMTLTCMQIF